MEEKETMSLAISLGFSLIGAVLDFLRDAGVPEDVIESEWDATMQKHASRSSDDLPHVRR